MTGAPDFLQFVWRRLQKGITYIEGLSEHELFGPLGKSDRSKLRLVFSEREVELKETGKAFLERAAFSPEVKDSAEELLETTEARGGTGYWITGM